MGDLRTSAKGLGKTTQAFKMTATIGSHVHFHWHLPCLSCRQFAQRPQSPARACQGGTENHRKPWGRFGKKGCLAILQDVDLSRHSTQCHNAHRTSIHEALSALSLAHPLPIPLVPILFEEGLLPFLWRAKKTTPRGITFLPWGGEGV